MRYSKEDFIVDYLYSNGGGSGYQIVLDNELKLSDEIEIDQNSINDKFIEDILLLDKAINIGKLTPYSLHKSHPSARSLYPIELLIKIDTGKFIKAKNFSDDYDVYKKHINETSKYDILLNFRDVYSKIEGYNSLRKSLVFLEIGHLQYNINRIANLYNTNYTYKFINDTIIMTIEKLPNYYVDTDKYKDFNNKILNRTSGPYKKFLTHKSRNKKVKKYIIDKPIKDAASRLYNINCDDVIYIEYFINNLYDGFDKVGTGTTIPYEKLSMLYPYIDFQTSSQYVLFYIKDNILMKNVDIGNILSMMGYLSQDICVNMSEQGFYNRPLKDVHYNQSSMILGECENYTPFYAVASGYFED